VPATQLTPGVAIEHVHDDALLVTGLAELMDVDLLGAHDGEQLAGEASEDRVGVLDSLGKLAEPAHPGEHRRKVELGCVAVGGGYAHTLNLAS
jgi:hypothetical protein